MVDHEPARGPESETVDAPAAVLPDPNPEKAPQQSTPAPELLLEFRGSAREYFRIWIVNLCLTLLTFGIFSAWAKVRRKRYLYSSTTIDGTPFQYLGQPIPILKGRLIAAAAFLLYYVSMNIFTSLIPFILGAAVVAAPWILVRSSAFSSRYSAFRNMTFHFDGGYLDAAKVLYMRGLIPAILIAIYIATLFNWPGIMIFAGVVILFLIFLFPWWIRGIKNFVLSHTSYGGKNGVFSATGGEVFGIYFVAAMIFFGVSVFSSVATLTLKAAKAEGAAYVTTLLMAAAYLMSLSYTKSHYGNLVWNNTRLAPIRFQSVLSCTGLLKLYLINSLGIICSLGLLIPWAVMRTMKYRADHMKVFRDGGLAEFQGSDMTAVAALGAETLDLFDMDLSL